MKCIHATAYKAHTQKRKIWKISLIDFFEMQFLKLRFLVLIESDKRSMCTVKMGTID